MRGWWKRTLERLERRQLWICSSGRWSVPRDVERDSTPPIVLARSTCQSGHSSRIKIGSRKKFSYAAHELAGRIICDEMG